MEVTLARATDRSRRRPALVNTTVHATPLELASANAEQDHARVQKRVTLKALPGVPQGTVVRVLAQDDARAYLAHYVLQAVATQEGAIVQAYVPRTFSVPARNFAESFRRTDKRLNDGQGN